MAEAPPSPFLPADARPPVCAAEGRLLRELDRGRAGPEAADGLAPPFPWRVQVQTLSACQAACRTCPWPQTRRELDHGRMEEATFRLLLDQVRGRGVRRFGLYLQNEPLLDPRLPAWTALAREALPGAALVIYTNGWWLTPELARELAAAGLDEIHVSLLAGEPGILNRHAPGTPLARILDTLDALGGLLQEGALGRLQVAVAALDLPGAAASLAAYAERWKAMGIPTHLAPVGNRAGSAGPARPPGATLVPCHLPFTRASILWDGRVVLCPSDWRRQAVLGNIRKIPLDVLWQCQTMRRLRRALLAGTPPPDAPCHRCDHPLVRRDALRRIRAGLAA